MSRTTEPAGGTARHAATDAVATVLAEVEDETQIDEELLIEEISIDGMCGVY